jgi:hypothetical protein
MALNEGMNEAALIARLDAMISERDVATWLEGAAGRLSARLVREAGTAIAFEVVPPSVLVPPAPTVSAWVFILRAGIYSGAERHPNSTQRMAALRGDGVFQTWDGGQWVSKPLASTASHPSNRWITIPPLVWHQSAPPSQDWVVVSFHTAPAEELIEERGDPASGSVLHHDTYL